MSQHKLQPQVTLIKPQLNSGLVQKLAGYNYVIIEYTNTQKQAGAELGQAQLKLGLDLNFL